MTITSRTTRFRLVEFDRNDLTSYTISHDYDKLDGRLFAGVIAGNLTGGHIEEYVDGIGWVVCED